MAPADRIDALAARWVRERPADDGIEERGRALAWGALGDRVENVAAILARSGVRGGDRVTIVAENSVALVACLFAASALDACAVVVNPRLTARELDAHPRRTRRRAARCSATGVAPEVDAHARARSAPIAVDDRRKSARWRRRRCDAATRRPPTDRRRGIVYTSGHVGRPKGVMLTHANLRFVAQTSARLRELDPGDRVYGALPIYHVYGLASMLLGTRRAQARASCRRSALRRASARSPRWRATASRSSRVCRRCTRACWSDCRKARGSRAPRLRYLYAGGSPLDPDAEARGRATLRPPAAQRLRADRVLADRCRRRGSPRRATTRRWGRRSKASSCASSRPSGADAPEGGVGELWVRGPNVMRGYYRDPQATAEADHRRRVAHDRRPRAPRCRRRAVHRRPREGTDHPLGAQRATRARSRPC